MKGVVFDASVWIEYFKAIPNFLLPASNCWKEVLCLGLIYEAGRFSQQEKLISKGVGLIDAIIIYGVMKHNLQLWTLDLKIKKFLHPDYIYSQ